MAEPAIEIVRLTPARVQGLLALLRALEASGEAEWFRPHPFTPEHLDSLCAKGGRDLYYVIADGPEAFGYGLLRGWDEGYEVPSLGIAIHPQHRGLGLGATLMEFLHSAARLRGSPRVRLRVGADNARAIALYRRVGYRFDEEAQETEAGPLLVGHKALGG